MLRVLHPPSCEVKDSFLDVSPANRRNFFRVLRGGSEGRRALGGDGEGAFEGEASAAESAFLEEAAD